MKHNWFQLQPIEIQLSEPASAGEKPAAPEWIQIARTGKFLGGKLVLDKEYLASLKKNFDAGVRGIDIYADFNHEKHGASAWYRELELREDGTRLFGKMAWTPKGKAAVEDKDFRYFSPSIDPNYLNEETGERFGPTLIGGGLTNQPVIKGMTPATELSEGEEEMTPEEIKALQDKLAAAEEKNTKLEAKVAELSEKVQASEKAKDLAEKNSEFAKLLSEGKAVPAQKEAYLAGDMKEFVKLAATVNLSEKGHSSEVTDEDEDETSERKETKTPAQDKVLELAEKKREQNKNLDETRAISLVLSENPKLAKEYRAETSV